MSLRACSWFSGDKHTHTLGNSKCWGASGMRLIQYYIGTCGLSYRLNGLESTPDILCSIRFFLALFRIQPSPGWGTICDGVNCYMYIRKCTIYYPWLWLLINIVVISCWRWRDWFHSNLKNNCECLFVYSIFILDISFNTKYWSPKRSRLKHYCILHYMYLKCTKVYTRYIYSTCT